MRPGINGHPLLSIALGLGIKEALNSPVHTVTRESVTEAVLLESRFLAFGLYKDGIGGAWEARAAEAGVFGPHFTNPKLGKHCRSFEAQLVSDSLCIRA